MKSKFASALVLVFILNACAPAAPTFDSKQVENNLATIVAMTVSALPTATGTNTPLPTPTETVPPAPAIASPTVIPVDIVVATPLPDYACEITRQDPGDDTEFHRGDSFDVEWTLVNSGTQKWEEGTVLRYQTGSKLTEEKEVALPRLKPGEKYNVALSATAPSEKKLHIMVWEVVGPGKTKDSMYWMCYPYVRIIVKR